MTFVLSTANVVDYLAEQHLLPSKEDEHWAKQPQIERRDYKNFNLWLRFSETQQFLVKQERFDGQGETSGDLAFEWRIQELLRTFPALTRLRSLITELLLYDAEHSILVSRYFSGYEDLERFYERTRDYSPALARRLGQAIAAVHQDTWHPMYREFLSQHDDGEPIDHQPRLLRQIDELSPEVFAYFPAESLEFFRLYQNTPQLSRAVQRLRHQWRSVCLIHRDLRLSNIVVRSEGFQSPAGFDAAAPLLRIIDWEKFAWGDPAYDLGTMLAHHLRLWLGSLVLHRDLPLKLALQLAGLPLEQLQPSLVQLVWGYCSSFPEIFQRDPGFLERAVQMTGLVLLEKVLLGLEHRSPFGNTDLCSLQVAQMLLSQPHHAAPQIFGVPWSELGVSTAVPSL